MAAAFGRSLGRAYALFGLGVLIGIALAFVIYLNSPPDALHDSSGCSHCQQYWGRYWEPETVVILELIGYFFYLLGIGVGGTTRIVFTAAVGAARRRQR